MKKELKLWLTTTVIAMQILIQTGCSSGNGEEQNILDENKENLVEVINETNDKENRKNLPLIEEKIESRKENIYDTKDHIQDADEEERKNVPITDEKTVSRGEDVQEIKEYIQDAINNANLIADNAFFQNINGETFYRKYVSNYAYSYYGKKIKQIRGSIAHDYVAILEDGSIYNGTTLVTNKYKVKDVLWKTNNVNIDAYLITENGQVLNYFPYNGTLYLEEGLNDIVAGCRYRSSTIFLDKNGNVYAEFFSGRESWSKCNIDGWKNVVVMACARNEEEDTTSVAAIAADGTVYATGDYAEEILSWGELAYISMDQNLIVGLRKDGTLVFAGSMADKFEKADFSEVKAVRVWSDEFIIMTNEGFITTNIIDFERKEDVDFLNNSNSEFGYLMMDSDGNVYENIYEQEESKWEKSTYYYVSALKNKPEISIYMSELAQTTTYWYNEEGKWEERKNKNIKFQVLDINKDGQLEIILKDIEKYPSLALGWLYNGKFKIKTIDIEWYYPNSGVIQSFTGGNTVKFSLLSDWIHCICGYYVWDDPDADGGQDISYFIMKEFKSDYIEILDYDSEKIFVDENEFNNFLASYIENEDKKRLITYSFMDNTYTNREEIYKNFLSK